MDNYGDLQSNVQSARGGRTDLPAYIYELVTADINRELRLLEMQSTSTLSATAESVSLPSDFLEIESLYIDATPRRPLFPVSEQAQAVRHDSSGQPAYYAVHDGAITLMPVPDGTYSLELRYYARLTDFAVDADTNNVLVNYPNVYLYGALMHASIWERDTESIQIYTSLYANAFEAARKADAKRRRGAVPLTRRSATRP